MARCTEEIINSFSVKEFDQIKSILGKDSVKTLETQFVQTESSKQHHDIILVTGGAGFVGGHIAQTLLSKGYKVIIYDIFNSETTPSKEKQETAHILQQTATQNEPNGASLKIIKGDICDTDTLRYVIKEEGITACFHIAAMVDDRRSVLYPLEYIDVNIKGTTGLLQILAEYNIKTLVQASTRSVFGQVTDNLTFMDEKAERLPINPYGATKVATDAFAHVYSHLYQMNIAIIRIFSTYGSRGRKDMIPRICVDNIHDGMAINKFGDGSATRNWIYIDDVVRAFILAFEAIKADRIKGYNQYNIGTDESTTLNEMIETVTKVIGKQPIINHLPVPKGDAHKVGYPNWSKIKNELGWMPQFSLEQGLRETYKYTLQTKSQQFF